MIATRNFILGACLFITTFISTESFGACVAPDPEADCSSGCIPVTANAQWLTTTSGQVHCVPRGAQVDIGTLMLQGSEFRVCGNLMVHSFIQSAVGPTILNIARSGLIEFPNEPGHKIVMNGSFKINNWGTFRGFQDFEAYSGTTGNEVRNSSTGSLEFVGRTLKFDGANANLTNQAGGNLVGDTIRANRSVSAPETFCLEPGSNNTVNRLFSSQENGFINGGSTSEACLNVINSVNIGTIQSFSPDPIFVCESTGILSTPLNPGSRWGNAIARGNCSACVVSNPLGLTSLRDDSFVSVVTPTLFPNTITLHVSNRAALDGAQITVIDSLGRTVYEEKSFNGTGTSDLVSLPVNQEVHGYLTVIIQPKQEKAITLRTLM